jgi:hypothetical protein
VDVRAEDFSVRRSMTRGIVRSIVLAFPAAALVGLVYRFPVPMAGYTRGPQALVYAPIAVFFYLMFGGVLVLVVLGALGGWAAFAVGRPRPELTPRMEWLFPGLVAVGGAVFLSILDLIIGPW